jgi:hypothetical protein
LRNDFQAGDELKVPEVVLYLFEDLPDGVTSTLGGDHNT